MVFNFLEIEIQAAASQFCAAAALYINLIKSLYLKFVKVSVLIKNLHYFAYYS